MFALFNVTEIYKTSYGCFLSVIPVNNMKNCWRVVKVSYRYLYIVGFRIYSLYEWKTSIGKARKLSKSLLVLFIKGFSENKKNIFQISKRPLILRPTPLVRAIGQEECLCPDHS